VTLVGDAAHAHGGAFAAGGSLALDDSFALGLAFKHVFSSGQAKISTADISKALGLYSKTRQPHAARLLRIVHNQIDNKPTTPATGEEENAALVTRMKGRPDTVWLSEHDVEAAFAAVVAQVEEAQRPVRAVGSGRGIAGAIQLQGSKL
jgi:salicylate hydroxylase